MTVNKMIKDLDVVDAFAPISNNKLNGVVGGGAWKNFWSSLRKGFYDSEAGRAIRR
ncbi:two-peptide bacteriocin plantaricin JK subunit PlnJ [Lactiplantibacillus plantarum]